jgi:hypothetical protein
VREVPQDQPISWQVTTDATQLPGKPFALKRVGTNKNDLANFVKKNKSWNRRQVDGLRSLFEPEIQKHGLMIYKVTGKLTDQQGGERLTISYIPFAYLDPDTSIIEGK